MIKVAGGKLDHPNKSDDDVSMILLFHKTPIITARPTTFTPETMIYKSASAFLVRLRKCSSRSILRSRIESGVTSTTSSVLI